MCSILWNPIPRPARSSAAGPPTMSALFVSEHRRATTTIHIDNQNNGVLA